MSTPDLCVFLFEEQGADGWAVRWGDDVSARVVYLEQELGDGQAGLEPLEVDTPTTSRSRGLR